MKAAVFSISMKGRSCWGRIEAENAANLTIRGRGVFCSSQEDHGAGRRPQMEFRNCDNLKIEGILLRDTPNWTLKIVGSTGVHIDNIKGDRLDHELRRHGFHLLPRCAGRKHLPA
ncbi:MAG: hypothetical protein ACLUQ6_13615 [Alistipes onderdonkii]